MDKKLFQSLVWLISYAALLILVVVHFSDILQFIGGVFSLFTPLVLGFALAFVLNRPCQLFFRCYGKILPSQKSTSLRLGLAVLTSYLLLLLLIFAGIAFVLPKFLVSIELFASSLEGYVANAQVLLNALLVDLDLDTLDLSGLNNILTNMLNSALDMMSSAVPHLFTLTGAILSSIVTGALAFVFSIYMLAGKYTLLRQLGRLVQAYLPPSVIPPLSRMTALCADTFTRFISGQIIEAVILGTLCGVGMLFIYPAYAALVGVIVGCTALVPVVGAYVGTILCALLLLMVSPVAAFAFVIFLLILQQIEGNLIYPRVVGTSVGLPGIWVLAAVSVGAGLGGIPGVLLSVPTASVLYTLLGRDVRRRLDPDPQTNHTPEI